MFSLKKGWVNGNVIASEDPDLFSIISECRTENSNPNFQESPLLLNVRNVRR